MVTFEAPVGCLLVEGNAILASLLSNTCVIKAGGILAQLRLNVGEQFS